MALRKHIRLWASLLWLGTLTGAGFAQGIDYSRVGITTGGTGFRGIVDCKSDLELAFPVAGIVARVPITEGAQVRAGQLLMTLQQQVETIELQRREEVWHDKADLQAAEAQLEQAKTQLDAAQRIYDQSRGISAEDLSKRQLQHDLLVAERARIQSQERIEKLDMQAARATLERRSLRAPSGGIISVVMRDVGEAVQPSDVVVRLCDTSELFLVTNIPAEHAAQLRLADTLSLQGTDPLTARDVVLDATVTFLSPVIDPASGLQRIRLRLTAPPDWLTPGAGLALDLAGD